MSELQQFWSQVECLWIEKLVKTTRICLASYWAARILVVAIHGTTRKTTSHSQRSSKRKCKIQQAFVLVSLSNGMDLAHGLWMILAFSSLLPIPQDFSQDTHELISYVQGGGRME